jgi:hypothetical protein
MRRKVRVKMRFFAGAYLVDELNVFTFSLTGTS